MAKKVIIGQPERPNSGQSVSMGGAVESGDKHIQNVADITLMTSAEVAALVSPTLADHESRLTALTDIAGHVLIESPSGNQVPLASFAANTLLGRTGSGTIAGRLITDFAAKAPPTAADVLLISDAAASNALKYITLADLLALVKTGNPYIDKPASPNAFDDECDTGSPDLATRGYTVVNASTGTVQTRSGNIAPWDATGPAAGTYWSQIIGSWLFIQAPVGIQLDIYKTITLAAGDTYFCRSSGSFCLATNANGRFHELGLYGANGAMLDNNNRVNVTVRDDTTANFLMYDVARTTASAGGSGATGRPALGGHDIRGVRFDSGTTHYGLIVDSQSGEAKSVNVTGAPAAGTLTRFGFRNLFSNAGGLVPNICAIDYIRKKTGNAWIAG